MSEQGPFSPLPEPNGSDKEKREKINNPESLPPYEPPQPPQEPGSQQSN